MYISSWLKRRTIFSTVNAHYICSIHNMSRTLFAFSVNRGFRSFFFCHRVQRDNEHAVALLYSSSYLHWIRMYKYQGLSTAQLNSIPDARREAVCFPGTSSRGAMCFGRSTSALQCHSTGYLTAIQCVLVFTFSLNDAPLNRFARRNRLKEVCRPSEEGAGYLFKGGCLDSCCRPLMSISLKQREHVGGSFW